MNLGRLVAATLAQLVTAAGTLIGLASWDASRSLRLVIGAAVFVLVLVAVTLEVSSYLSERAKGYKTPSRINRFMHDWISQRGQVVIFSRDMSWVSDNVHVHWYERLWRQVRDQEPPTIHELLFDKAARGELTVCLPTETNLARELREAGAHVAVYSGLDVIPEARFTIVRYGQQDAEVAIGRRERGAHRIETFASGHHPVFAMAEDLVRIVRSYSERS